MKAYLTAEQLVLRSDFGRLAARARYHRTDSDVDIHELDDHIWAPAQDPLRRETTIPDEIDRIPIWGM